MRVQAQTFERLVTGQIKETVGAQPGEDPIAHYLGVLADKTGSLVATSARFGASFAGVEESLVAALTAFGEEVGVAFQISDDLLDIVSQGGASGKSPGTDLREGIATLPALFALAGDDPAEARLRELVAAPISDDDDHAEALGPAALVALAGAGQRGARPVRRPGPRAAGAGSGGRRPRRAVGAVRLRGHPHQLRADPGPMRTLAGLIAAALLLAGCTAAPSSSSTGAARRHRRTRTRRCARARRDGRRRRARPPVGRRAGADGTLLFDERAGGFTAVLPDGTVQHVQADMDDLFARGETGLMGLVLDPGFDANRRFYSCQGVTDGAAASIAVIAWTVSADWRSATRVADPLIGDIPVNEGSGRHGGCRLRFTPDGALLIATGDNAVGSNPQDRSSRAGKVLLADPATGEVAVWTYGHRNVQGLAVRPGTNQIFAVEQGTFRDDEVNLLRAGGNYGYDPNGADGATTRACP